MTQVLRLRTPDGRINEVGKRVRQRRDELGVLQDALCARLAVETAGAWNPDRRDIGRIETGSRIVTDLEVFALARALECDAMWFFTGSEPRPG